MCRYVQMFAGNIGVTDILEWVLRSELRSSATAVHALNWRYDETYLYFPNFLFSMKREY